MDGVISMTGEKKWQDKMNPWNNPPTKQETKDYFGNSIIQLFKELFSRRVKHQPGFDVISIHTIVGQLPSVRDMSIYVDDNKLDLRISACIFKPSGSGGGRAFSFVSEVCQGLGMRFQPITEITDAALIGTINIEMEYDPEEKCRVEVPVYEPGVLCPNREDDPNDPPVNIVAMGEASLLFDGKQSEYKKNAMHYYQIALNPMGTSDNLLSKKLAKGQWIQFHPNCSLFLVSYPPDSLYETIIKRGFLQRMMLVYSQLDSDDRKQISKELTSLIGRRTDGEGDINQLINRLKYINLYWTGKPAPKLSDKAREPLEKVVDAFYDRLESVGEFPRAKLEEFTHRWIEITWRLAWHHAVLRLSPTVQMRDVAYAKNIMIPLWRETIGLIEEGIELPRGAERKWKRHIIDMVEAYEEICRKRKVEIGDKIPRALLKRKLQDKSHGWGVSGKTANERLTRAEDAGFFERSYAKGESGATIPWIKKLRDPNWRS